MKKRVLCIALALLMCMAIVLPAFADGDADTPPDRAPISISYGLRHKTGSTYKMWATIRNLGEENIIANLILYDASYNYITSVSVTSSDSIFSFGKNVTLSSGTYHLELYYEADTSSGTSEKTYNI